MTVVRHMVCPLCATVNGQQHRKGCPNNIPDPEPLYVAGWSSAMDALIAPLAKEIGQLQDSAVKLKAARLALEAAIVHVDELRMDTAEDEAVRLRLLETLRLAEDFARA